MVDVKSPLFGFGASKSIGKVLTYRRHRGKTIVQHKFTPYDPKSTNQLSIRVAMHELQLLWRTLTNYQKSSWNNYAKEGPYKNQTGYSLFLKLNFQQYHEAGIFDTWADWDMIVTLTTGEILTLTTGEILVINQGD